MPSLRSPLTILLHGVLLATQIDRHAACIGGVGAEIDPILGIDTRIVVSGHIGRGGTGEGKYILRLCGRGIGFGVRMLRPQERGEHQSEQ